MAALCLAPLHAQEADHSGHASPGSSARSSAPQAPSDHAADAVYDPQEMQRARDALALETGGLRYGKVMFNLAEARFDSGTSWRLEGEAWYGSDRNRALLRFDGELEDGSLEHARIEALYSRAISTWWNLVAGVRYDPRPEPDRALLALGIEGLAPYGVHLSATGYAADEGDLRLRVEAYSDLRITQRLVMQPRGEIELAEDTRIELGLRLRYEWRRELAPYLGLEWQDGSAFSDDALRVVAGVRAWF